MWKFFQIIQKIWIVYPEIIIRELPHLAARWWREVARGGASMYPEIVIFLSTFS